MSAAGWIGLGLLAVHAVLLVLVLARGPVNRGAARLYRWWRSR